MGLVIVMKKIAINEEIDNAIYVVYDKNHRYVDCISIYTPVIQYLNENPQIKFVERVEIYDDIL